MCQMLIGSDFEKSLTNRIFNLTHVRCRSLTIMYHARPSTEWHNIIQLKWCFSNNNAIISIKLLNGIVFVCSFWLSCMQRWFEFFLLNKRLHRAKFDVLCIQNIHINRFWTRVETCKRHTCTERRKKKRRKKRRTWIQREIKCDYVEMKNIIYAK